MSVKICLDAGHHGKYNQSPVIPEYYESEAMWKLHLLLKHELETYGIEVVTTRSDINKDLNIVTRGEVSKGCDMFISLHSNAAGANADHVELYYQVDDNCGKMDEQSAAFAKLIGDAVATTMGLELKLYSKKSDQDRDKNGYKDDYYGVLRGAHNVHTPGVLIEHGFHTNLQNTKWLMQESNLIKLAKAEADAIANYFNISKPVENGQWYRIATSWEDAKKQVGAYTDLETAKIQCDVQLKVFDNEGNVVYPEPITTHIYRVRKSWSDSKSQLGAFKNIKNAIMVCKSGYLIFDENGNTVWSPDI